MDQQPKVMGSRGLQSMATGEHLPRHGKYGPSWPLVLVVMSTFSAAMYLVLCGEHSLESPTFAEISMPARGTVPASALFALRLVSFLLIFISLTASLTDSTPHSFKSQVWKQSKLTQTTILVKGLQRLTTFTVQCWTLQLVYFTLTTGISVWHFAGLPSEGMAAHAVGWLAHAAYAVSLPCAFLTTVVVTFVLLPSRLKAGDYESITRMLTLRPQLMHNANLLLMVNELLLCSLPLEVSHFSLCVIFGLLYVIGSWVWLRKSGVVYYPFLDPTLPSFMAISLHLLLLITLAVFALFANLVARTTADLPLTVRVSLLYALAFSLMHTHHIRGVPPAMKAALAAEAGSMDSGGQVDCQAGSNLVKWL